MSKAYDIDTLRRGREVVMENITAMETALLKERGLLAHYDQEIAAAESILKAHAVICTNENHDWEIIATFENGNWKKRNCRKCPTKQRLGSS